MQCEDIRKHFADYLDLPTELPPAVLDHVSTCGACKLEFAELCELWEDLARVPAPAPDSAAMRARFSEALALASQPTPPLIRPARPQRQWWPRQWTLRVAAVAASISILAFVSVSAWRAFVAPTSVTIDGVARDGAGDAIPGVAVVAINSATRARSAALTDKDGKYSFSNLPLGTYSVTADLEGFQSARYSEVVANKTDVVHVPFPLQAGASSGPMELTIVAEPVLQAKAERRESEKAEKLKESIPKAGTFENYIEMDGNTNATRPPVAAPAGAPGAPASKRPYADEDGLPRVWAAQAAQGRGRGQGAGQMGQGGQQGGQQQGQAPGGGGGGRGEQDAQQRRSSNSQDLRDLFGLELDQKRSQYEDANKDAMVRTFGQRVIPPAGIATIVANEPAMPAGRVDSFNSSQTNSEIYDRITDNAFVSVGSDPLATFSTDVDTASYTNVRRFLTQNQLPPRNAVRIEELINYFHYNYPQGSTDHPITASVEVAAAPWNPDHRLVRIGLKAKDVRLDRQPTNLVFLIDVSGSMSSPDRLPLLKNGLKLLVAQLTENDKVTIVTYAGTTGVALQPTNGLEKETILRAIEGLNAEGSTNGGSGIQMAYSAAVSSFVRNGVNRVILATDGDFNVGITNTNELVKLIEEKAKSGVFLSVLGFGSGNLKDSMMEKLADHGNGHYVYIDSLDEARKVLVDDIAGTLVTVAKDVKIQVEFNPAEANAYRLIGYENRALTAADFKDDNKDAGDMGAGHTVTALFEVIPRGVAVKTIDDQPLRFQPAEAKTVATNGKTTNELLNLKIRYKLPDGATSKLIELQLVDRKQTFAKASPDFRFAAAVAAFGMILRDSPHKGTANWDLVRSIAFDSRGQDRSGAREEFMQLVERAQRMWRR